MGIIVGIILFSFVVFIVDRMTVRKLHIAKNRQWFFAILLLVTVIASFIQEL
ncbi:hypothetical protein [Herbaspirillum huttiense]|uniref:Uncharacterized protein n=1 Tax=Herbaspirillum huttiense subsp. lycopersici TaxID=3074428 RepID=A0ABU2EFZ1_9BURK|nr:hypothetical protein [Herbaspirillum huttiense]MDR9847041.1 hypothetical protein [Herbaspirillum huttiense SE1]